MTQMQFKQLEAFLHVAELGSYTRAAEILDTTQPALSHLVRQLETGFRQHLLIRNGRGVATTEAGKVLLAHAKGIIEQCARAEQDMAALQGKMTGHFTIGLITGVARSTTLLLIQGFKEQFPNATISTMEGFTGYLMEWLLMGRIDVAVLNDTSKTPFIEKRHLMEQEVVLIGPPGALSEIVEPPPFSKIADYPLITTGRMHGIRQTLESKAVELGFDLKIAFEVDSVESILDLVMAGYGYAVLHPGAVWSDVKKRDFRVVHFREPRPTIRLILATSNRHQTSTLAKKAIEMVYQRLLDFYSDRDILRRDDVVDRMNNSVPNIGTKKAGPTSNSKK